MSERYDADAAYRYAAYRPPLHALILDRVLPKETRFRLGVDIGSGTGHSALALASHCTRVIAIERSPAMISAAAEHPRVEYVCATAETLPIRSHTADLITFAGSLFYTDRPQVAAQVLRICRTDALVVVYDFEILLSEVLASLGYRPSPSASQYDHAANFSGLAGFADVATRKERVQLSLTAAQLRHVLLADSNILDWVRSRYGDDALPLRDGEVPADLYVTVYRPTQA